MCYFLEFDFGVATGGRPKPEFLLLTGTVEVNALVQGKYGDSISARTPNLLSESGTPCYWASLPISSCCKIIFTISVFYFFSCHFKLKRVRTNVPLITWHWETEQQGLLLCIVLVALGDRKMSHCLFLLAEAAVITIVFITPFDQVGFARPIAVLRRLRLR